MIIRDERTSVIVPCFCRSLRWRTEQRSTARCGGRDPVRLNNTRQALLLLLLPYFCLPALAPVPSHRFQLGLSCSPHSFSTFSSISSHLSHPLSSYARHLPTSSGSARVSGPTPRGVKPYFPWLILQACTQHVLPVLFCFCLFFALRCCIICCQVRLPVFVTHICKSFI